MISLQPDCSCVEVEKFISDHESNSILDESTRKSISSILQLFLDREDNGTNAKSRRKISRYQLSLLEDPVKDIPSNDGVTSITATSTPASTSSISISMLIKYLSESKSCHDVEYALNSFNLQIEFNNLEQNRLSLKAQLENTLSAMSLSLNRLLKRRLERLLFVISTKEEQEVLKSKPKAATTVVKKSSATQRLNNNNSQDTPTPMNSAFQQKLASSSITAALNKLSNVSSSTELESSLSQLQEIALESASTEHKLELAHILEPLLQTAEKSPSDESKAGSFEINSKNKRRIRRLLERMNPTTSSSSANDDNHPTVAEAIPSCSLSTTTPITKPVGKAPVKNLITSATSPAPPLAKKTGEVPAKSASAPLPTKPTAIAAPAVSSGMKTSLFFEFRNKLSAASKAADVDALAARLAASSPELASQSQRAELVALLQEIVLNLSLVNNTKSRRFINRLISRMQSLPQAKGDTEESHNESVAGEKDKDRVRLSDDVNADMSSKVQKLST